MATKRDLFLAQGGKCFYCGRFMKAFAWNKYNPQGWTRDHFWPKSKPDGIVVAQEENAVLACSKCNSTKSNVMPTVKQVHKYNRLYRLLGMV
jgi:5-methylcytosine-specific restriction endonuclease McrA